MCVCLCVHISNSVHLTRYEWYEPKNSYKKVILDVCAQRGDAQADALSVRVNGAIENLHSAEAGPAPGPDCRGV